MSAESEVGKVEQHCDPTSAEDLIRVLGTAHGEYLRGRVERERRGVPDGAPDGNRRCWGNMVWRLNDSWPIIYWSVIDYYLAPKIRMVDDRIEMKTDVFAYQVSLEADGVGEALTNAAVFEDNYFDLPHGHKRTIAVLDTAGLRRTQSSRGRQVTVRALNAKPIRLGIGPPARPKPLRRGEGPGRTSPATKSRAP